jgi:hypothetical protein
LLVRFSEIVPWHSNAEDLAFITLALPRGIGCFIGSHWVSLPGGPGVGSP